MSPTPRFLTRICPCPKRRKLATDAFRPLTSPETLVLSVRCAPLTSLSTSQVEAYPRIQNDTTRPLHRYKSSRLHPTRIAQPRISPPKHSVRQASSFQAVSRPLSDQNGVRHLSNISPQNNMHQAVVAFGSNLGDRIAHIENALQSLKANAVQVTHISQLYETKPMYYEDQAPFLNGVFLVNTDLDPLGLLDLLQQIELDQGRRRDIHKGPRTLDLDIILYDDMQIDHERLQVPHPLMAEREFVLRPLADVLENSSILPIVSHRNVTMQQALDSVTNTSMPMHPVSCFSNSHHLKIPATSTTRRQTLVMSILNLTPDSFSDGGMLTSAGVEGVVETAKSHIASGATILDIGGQSTRPNATLISASEELSRILPALRAIKLIPEVASGQILVSVDTFYSSVAQACLQEGLVDIINDISGGAMDPIILQVVAQHQKSIVLMHMRGTPQNMNKFTNYENADVEAGVAAELVESVNKALAAGIPPWRIILDPGLGFAKDAEGNLRLLAGGPLSLVKLQPSLKGYAWLVGPSRKGFIGKITGVTKAQDRGWGTAACVSASVVRGADIVRVHDVAEMCQVVKVSDAIFGSKS